MAKGGKENGYQGKLPKNATRVKEAPKRFFRGIERATLEGKPESEGRMSWERKGKRVIISFKNCGRIEDDGRHVALIGLETCHALGERDRKVGGQKRRKGDYGDRKKQRGRKTGTLLE